jgi:hypothetical protein
MQRAPFWYKKEYMTLERNLNEGIPLLNGNIQNPDRLVAESEIMLASTVYDHFIDLLNKESFLRAVEKGGVNFFDNGSS